MKKENIQVKDMSEVQFQELCHRIMYEVHTPIEKLIEEYSIEPMSAQKLIALLEPIVVPNKFCECCGAQLFQKVTRRNPKKIFCKTCNHILSSECKCDFCVLTKDSLRLEERKNKLNEENLYISVEEKRIKSARRALNRKWKIGGNKNSKVSFLRDVFK